MPVRLSRAALVLVVGLTLGIVGVAMFSRSTASAPTARLLHQTGAGTVPAPLTVLHEWDSRRAAAWASGDPAALARLYTAGSSAAGADVAMLRRYLERGLRVRGMRMQVIGMRTLTARSDLLVLEVTDRLESAVAVRVGDPRTARRLPSDIATTHRIVLRRVSGRWLVDQVSTSARARGR